MPPIPSPAADSEPMPKDRFPASSAGPEFLTDLTPALAEAISLIAGFGAYGVVWLDTDLKVLQCYGRLVDFVATSTPITDSVLALIGLEDEIRALHGTEGRILELPAVGVAKPDGDTQRLNFSIFWQASQNAYLILVYRIASQTELELELSRQIRARLMAEAAVTAKSKELARANTDLESFAAIITHDLKAPMRHMRRMAESLAAEAETQGSGTFGPRLKEIELQAKRMSHMLSALLDYSSLGRKYEAVAEVDTGKLVESIVTSLPRSGIAIQVAGTWPKFATLAAPLDLVIRNLIDNAIKHHDLADGTVTVTCEDGHQALSIAVGDDGPGIDPRHHEAAFLPFRTLQSRAGQQGTGMGLAMVKKTVETAGGTITLASDPGRKRGTIITVSWPKYIVT
jgi:signal transduction histidine kinase